MSRSVFFHVQHLLGIGHARRAALVAAALARAGWRVTVAEGGLPVPGIDYGGAEVVRLPALRSDGADFARLVDETGRPIDDAWRARRAAATLAAFTDRPADVLLIEGFPFARGALRFELVPLIEAARRRTRPPLVACSVRDILVEKKNPARLEGMAGEARALFDLVLVHGDPVVIPFEATFPPAGRIADLIRYTGYVAADPGCAREVGPGDGAGEVVVSVGGGAVGAALLQAAAAARALLPADGPAWRLLAGPDTPEAAVPALGSAPGLIVERARPDFPDLLRRCALSISQAGYNTLMDILGAGCRAILVPFAAPGETEQTARARLLEARGLTRVLDEATLTPAGLAEAAMAALAAPKPPAAAIDRDGAAATVRCLEAALAERPARADAP